MYELNDIKAQVNINRDTMYIDDLTVLELQMLMVRYLNTLGQTDLLWKSKMESIVNSLNEVRNRDNSVTRTHTILSLLDEFIYIKSCMYYNDTNHNTYNDDFIPEARRRQIKKVFVQDLNQEEYTPKATIDKVLECIKANVLLMSDDQYCNPNGLALLARDTVVLIKQTIKKYSQEKMQVIIDKYTNSKKIQRYDIYYMIMHFIFDITALAETFE